LREKIRVLQERKEKYQTLKQGLKGSGEKQVSLTDADARAARVNDFETPTDRNLV
jgi:hypothetical protein